MKSEISEELAQAILNYLSTKPFAEVVKLVQGLQSLQEIKEVKEVEKPKK